MTSPLSRFLTGPKPQEAAMLPGNRFFVRRLAVEGEDLAGQVNLALEAVSPFPLEQMLVGFVTSADGRQVLAYAAHRRRFTAEESFAWPEDCQVVPEFLALCGHKPAADGVVVEGTSMLPQLKDGERLLVNKLIYYDIKSVSWGHIDRGDVVVFWYPNDPSKSFVKRVIGLPGEVVEIRAGKVFINNRELDEEYLTDEFNQTLPSFDPTRVDNHHYFVLGDNRDNSSDSRYWGLVPAKYIYGKAFFRYWKPEDMGVIEHADYRGFTATEGRVITKEEVSDR